MSWSSYDYGGYQPEAGVVNFYQLRNTLTAHVDKSEENMEAPLVSLSIGHACIYLLGGEDRGQPPVPIYLRSGDVLVMTGASRYAYHGVPRIVENSLPDWLRVT
ncbi:alpha-ketoglutarate-dependent dioxygenase AlkB-like protein, partial [Syncephalis pseudoplumigaleata]